MELTEWLETIKKAKQGSLMTGSTGSDVKVFTNVDRTELTIRSNVTKCHKCNTLCSSKVKVKFNQPQQNLTMFQAGLLYYLFCLNKKPIDYAGYHNCVAGKQFIENIKGVEAQ